MDILDTFDEIKIGVCYKLNGKILDSMPGQQQPLLLSSPCIYPSFIYAATQALLEEVEVDYVTMPGWQTIIAHMKSLEELPPNARAYVNKLSELTGMKSKLDIQWNLS